MMNKSILIVAALACFVAPAFGQTPAIDYLGFGWEAGGFPPSDAGDVLYITCVSVSADAIFGIDLDAEELTVYIYGLVSTGGVDAGGTTVIGYTGGFLEIYNDPAKNADWGINPPNLTAPGTFMDGNLFFKGSFNNFMMFLGPTGAGTFESTLNGIGGSMIDDSCIGCAYTWGGGFTTAGTNAQIPEGYDLQIDGLFEIEAAVPTEESSWGSLKALYRK